MNQNRSVYCVNDISNSYPWHSKNETFQNMTCNKSIDIFGLNKCRLHKKLREYNQ